MVPTTLGPGEIMGWLFGNGISYDGLKGVCWYYNLWTVLCAIMMVLLMKDMVVWNPVFFKCLLIISVHVLGIRVELLINPIIGIIVNLMVILLKVLLHLIVKMCHGVVLRDIFIVCIKAV